MPIYVGSQKIKDIYYGGVKIGKIYRGNTLVYTSLAYPSDTIVYESSTAGISTVELEEGIYEVYCIAGGSGGAAVGGTSTNRAVAVGGASGSGFIGKVRLNKGTYKITVGAGGAGSSGAYRYTATSTAGASVYGSYGAGGASTALNGGGTHEDGSSGYIKIVYKGRS